MALGFTSHYKSGEQAFGTLTQMSYSNDTESTGTVANYPSLIIGQDSSVFNKNITYDSCEFSSPVVIDYTQYASIADGGTSCETAGSVAYVGPSGSSIGVSSSGSVASFSGGSAASFSGGGGGMSCASFTC